MFPKHKKEFIGILKRINPDQVLVEIEKNASKLNKYPKELVFAYKWAKKNHKRDGFFDTNKYGNQIKKSINKKQLKQALKEELNLIKKYDWKKMNNKKIIDKIMKANKIIDFKQLRARQKIMLNNINKFSIKEGTILILTGAGHLSFFERHIKGAIFPFRR